jgi:peroxiredoxin
MVKLFLVIAVSAFLSLNCSKMKDTSVKDIKPKDNNQTSGQQNQNGSTQTTSSGSSFAVKDVGTSDKRNEMVDFTWVENGKEMKLSDYKGKVIFLNFWATWCGPCRKELPSLSQLSSELKDKDFKMIGISVDDNQEVLNKFLQGNSLSYTVLFEPNELVAKYMNTAGQTQNVIPQTYIIDKNGKVVEAILGSRSKEDFLSILNKYL